MVCYGIFWSGQLGRLQNQSAAKQSVFLRIQVRVCSQTKGLERG